MPDRKEFNPQSHDSTDAHSAPEDQGGSEKPPQDEISAEDPCIPAGFWLRVWACIIDGVILSAALHVFAGVIGIAAVSSLALFTALASVLRDLSAPFDLGSLAPLLVGTAAAFITVLLMVLAAQILYGALFESSALRATPGKLAVGIYVLSGDGRPCALLRTFNRNAFKLLSASALALGYLMAAFTARKQALHDILSDTIVVRRPDLAPQQVYLSAVFALSLMVLHGFWAESPAKTSPPDAFSPSVVSLPPQTTPAVKAPQAPSTGMRPAADGSGVISINHESYDLMGAYVRFRQTQLAFDQSVFDQREDTSKIIEIALFREELSPQEAVMLETAPSLIEDSARLLTKRPVLELDLHFSSHLQICDGAGILHSRLLFDRSALATDGAASQSIAKLHFPLESMLAAGRFMTFCARLEDGQELTVSFEGEDELKAGAPASVAWNVKFRGMMHPFRALGRQHYESRGEPLVLWNPGKGELKLGFFSMPLSYSESASILASGNLGALKEKQPDVTVVLPMPPQAGNVNRENVDNGYTLLICGGSKGGISLPSDDSQLKIEIPPGDLPKTLYGSLQEGKRLVGRLEGHKNIPFKNGLFEFSWLLSFNGEVHVVR